MASLIHSGPESVCNGPRLWLVGNGLSDTLMRLAKWTQQGLWLVGNGLSDTLRQWVG